MDKIECKFENGSIEFVSVDRISTAIGRGVHGVSYLQDLAKQGIRCGAEWFTYTGDLAYVGTVCILESWEW